jgi:UDP:flavonoid glycosyltransferase YjiC (YdhE family)
MKAGTSTVVFCMEGHGHIKRLLPLISGLACAGLRNYVFTQPRFQEEIENAGGVFVDLFRGRPRDEVDASSLPISCRNVSFAGHYAEQIVSEAAALNPSLVLSDTFAVIAPVVARCLGVPRVNVCAGHNYPPTTALEGLRHYLRIHVSEDCWRAVRTLREKYGMADASPYSFLTGLSSDLNLYCEPPQYLPEDQRGPFQPVVFMGSLSEQTVSRAPAATSPYGEGAAGKQRIYVSFGTIVWRNFEDAARGAMEVIREAVAELPDSIALASLGGAQLGDWGQRMRLPNFRVESYVDQWSVLGESSVYITHHGLNSTHEAAFQGVPMISYPFFHDQPGLAKRSQELGLAVPLVAGTREQFSPANVHAALSRVAVQRERMRARLAEARQWELDVIAGRSGVIQRILDLIP